MEHKSDQNRPYFRTVPQCPGCCTICTSNNCYTVISINAHHSTPRIQKNKFASHRQGKVLPYIEKIGTKIRKLGEKKERLKGQGGYALATIRR